jgi:hypothetical protein
LSLFDDIGQMQYLLMRLLSKMKILLLSSVEVKLFQVLIEKVSIHSLQYYILLNS